MKFRLESKDSAGFKIIVEGKAKSSDSLIRAAKEIFGDWRIEYLTEYEIKCPEDGFIFKEICEAADGTV